MNNFSHPFRSVGVVIPAFNEAGNLPQVLETLSQVGWLAQIVVVDDGSSDDTLAVASRHAARDSRIVPLRSPENQGKAAAMLLGVQALQTNTAIFLDADLIGLQPRQLWQLYQPVETGLYQMTLAVFRHGRFLTDAAHRLTPNLSGQRCLARSAAENILLQLAASRYGAEIGLTVYAKQQKWAIKRVVWQGVTHVMKEQKRKGLAGVVQRRQMYNQIIKTWLAAQKPLPARLPVVIHHARPKYPLYEIFKG